MRVGRRNALGLAPRLLAAYVLVVLMGSLTAWIVAATVGPPLFHEHLRRAGATSAAEVQHAEAAFRSANAIALSVALLAALVAALAVSVFATHRIGRSVTAAAKTATEVADGNYDTRVPPPGIGKEFDRLADAINRMAARLGSVEATRRRLLADVAHEVRTPVATLAAYLEGLEDGVTTLDARTAGVLRAQTARLIRLVDDMQAVSRVEEHQVELRRIPTTAERLVATAVAAAADPYGAKGVTLTSNPSGRVPALEVDPDRISQVLGNLLANALRHTPSGGSVVVSIHPMESGVEISVSDTGEGIASEHLPHVFERFYRADAARDRQHGGSGIGLAIAKALVQAHGGRISASSDGLGRGSTFRVWLPSAGQPTRSAM